MEGNLIKINKWLYPVSWIYGTGVWLRNKLFDWGIYKERKFDIPVISVGNITVGGTGKTPHTEYLIRLLQKDYKVAVLSRGYKRKSKGFVLARPDTSVQMIGDEPFQMKQKFPDIHMAVDRDRCHGIEQLCNSHIAPGTEVIIWMMLPAPICKARNKHLISRLPPTDLRRHLAACRTNART